MTPTKDWGLRKAGRSRGRASQKTSRLGRAREIQQNALFSHCWICSVRLENSTFLNPTYELRTVTSNAQTSRIETDRQKKTQYDLKKTDIRLFFLNSDFWLLNSSTASSRETENPHDAAPCQVLSPFPQTFLLDYHSFRHLVRLFPLVQQLHEF